MKDPAWIAALFAVLGLFLGIGWLFLAMIAVFVALIAAGSVDNAPAHGHGHDSHGHDSHGHGSGHGHDAHGSHAVHAEPKPIGGFLDVFIGQLLFAKKMAKKDESKPATTTASAPAAHDHHDHHHEHEHDPRPVIFKGDVFEEHLEKDEKGNLKEKPDWRYKAFNRKPPH